MKRRAREISELLAEYRRRKNEITARLKDFRAAGMADDADVFAELCFCILTPQSKAFACDKIISDLRAEGLIGCRDPGSLQPYLKRTRFYKNKSRYLAEARMACDRGGFLSIKDKIDYGNILATREWLVRNIKGIGYKEASHFLRNIGLGDSIAILDVHILRRLCSLGVINEVPKTLTRKKYLEIENLMRDFSRRVKIPLAHMDLLLWSMATGKIFK